MTVQITRARPVDLSRDQLALVAHVAGEYAEGFVEDQYPEQQGGELTGWDWRDQACLEDCASMLWRRVQDPRPLRLTGRQRVLLGIACELFADEYPGELPDAVGDRLDQATCELLTRQASGVLCDGVNGDVMFTAKGL